MAKGSFINNQLRIKKPNVTCHYIMNAQQLISSKNIKSTQLLKEREPIQRLTIRPFILFYVAWVAWVVYESCTSSTYGIFHFLLELNMDEVDGFKNDLQWIVVCSIIVLHALFFLMTHWSIEFDAKCSYYSVSSSFSYLITVVIR